MEPEKLLEALHTAEKLKDTTRHCYTSKGRHESVAEQDRKSTRLNSSHRSQSRMPSSA